MKGGQEAGREIHSVQTPGTKRGSTVSPGETVSRGFLSPQLRGGKWLQAKRLLIYTHTHTTTHTLTRARAQLLYRPIFLRQLKQKAQTAKRQPAPPGARVSATVSSPRPPESPRRGPTRRAPALPPEAPRRRGQAGGPERPPRLPRALRPALGARRRRLLLSRAAAPGAGTAVTTAPRPPHLRAPVAAAPRSSASSSPAPPPPPPPAASPQRLRRVSASLSSRCRRCRRRRRWGRLRAT